MLEFMILMAVLMILMKIPVGEAPPDDYDPYDNGTEEKFVLDKRWEFESLDDCMEFRELRRGGWRGNAQDYYRLKAEE